MEEMVSIIVPTYNREKTINRAVQSILQQTYKYYEILIVDDGSTDNTKEVIRKIEDDRIRYIRYENNQGVSHARNVGIQEARYDYIAFLDSDDEWFPVKLEHQMQKMLESPDDVGLVFCRMGGFHRESSERYILPPKEYTPEILEGNIFRPLLLHNVIGLPTMIVRRKCLEQSGGGFIESLRCLEDWELILRIAKNWKIGFIDEVLVEVYKTAGSVSTNAIGYIITRCYLVSLYQEEMREIGILQDTQEEILEAARRYNIYEEIKELLTRDIQL